MAGTNFQFPVNSTLTAEFIDGDGLMTKGFCTGVPPTTASIFAHGCLLTRTDSGTGNKAVYENVGSSAVPSWNLIGDITAGEITLAENNLLQGNSSGVATAVTSITLPKEGSRTISVATTTTSNTVGGSLGVTSGAGAGTGNGGAVSITGGASGSGATGTGGAAALTGGAASSTNGVGGSATMMGGAGAGTGAGGASGLSGGTGGATGAGGAISISGGAGGATSGTGGSVLLAGGAGTAGNSAGGAMNVYGGTGQGTGAGGATSVAGGAGGASGNGGGVTIYGNDGGATAGNGGNVAVTGGNATANNDDGGNVTLTPGTQHGTGLPGAIYLRGALAIKQGTPTAKTTSATLTVAELAPGIITVNQGGGASSALQLPTASDLDTAFVNFTTDDSFNFSVINISTVAAEDASLTTNTGLTLVGNMDVASNAAATDKSAGSFRLRKTGAAAWTCYRIS